LRVVELVVLTAPVACSDPQAAVRPELKLPSVVVARARMLDDEEGTSAGRVGVRRVGRGTGELVDADVPVEVCVVDVETARTLVVGRCGHRQQAALATDAHERRDVQKRVGRDLIIDDQSQPTP
jgi:hypothetical protein